MTGSPTAPHASDSAEQRAAERAIVAAVAEQLGVALAPARIAIDDAHVEIDGASSDRTVLVEAYARIGALKGAQPRKLATDAFKLAWAGRKRGATRLILAVADETAAGYLRRPGAWLTAAIRDAGIEVVVAGLDDATRQSILAAQARQYR
ncbi:hypothetical protein E0W80_09565 [Microbacterium sp. PI-1]|uniref:hypothetical protein n=1 Tax=unclassified Microbacterium TaxID=2609290 RepID=UPI00103FF59F|nr:MULTISPECIES: hypothetical protein [unclassified Microbacterium]TCJ23796.1 hypothetical protein E0W80_09565 [Microbacterium sp. PI-1]UUE20063.1 hypothetical protein LRQ07_14890 [Microbacterium sp. J1-1]